MRHCLPRVMYKCATDWLHRGSRDVKYDWCFDGYQLHNHKSQIGKYAKISNSTIQLDSETRHYRTSWDYTPMSKCIASSFTRYQMKQCEYFFLNVDMVLRQGWGKNTREHGWCISKFCLTTWYNPWRMYRIHVLSLSGISVKNGTHRNRPCLIWNGWKGVYSDKG